MGVLSIFRTAIRYWWVTIPVMLLTIAGAVYVAKYLPKTYEATTTYLLLNPPPSRATRTNPFLQLPDPAAIVGVLTESTNSKATAEKLVAQGASEDYEVGPSQTYGAGSRIIEVYAPGKSPAESLRTAELVGGELARQLKSLQLQEGVDKKAYISILGLSPVPNAELKVSSVLRSVLAVLVLGTILLFVLVSLAQARDELRASKRKRTEATDEAKQAVAPPTQDDPGPRRPRADQALPAAQ